MAPTTPYATEQDLTTFGVTAPADVDVYLRAASKLVYRACLNDLYAVDSDAMPTRADLRLAMNVATCVQVGAWVRLEIDPRDQSATVRESGTVVSAGIGSGSYSMSDAQAGQVAQLKAHTLTHLVPDARAELRDVGLASITVGI